MTSISSSRGSNFKNADNMGINWKFSSGILGTKNAPISRGSPPSDFSLLNGVKDLALLVGHSGA